MLLILNVVKFILQVDVTVAGVAGSNPVKGGHDILVCPDVSLEEVADKEFDVVIIPGGMGGVRNLSEVIFEFNSTCFYKLLHDIIRYFIQ